MSVEVPNARQAHVDKTKVVDYLLSESHSDGRSKAAFFLSFGFNRGRWGGLAEALRTHGAANEVSAIEESNYGTRYMVDGIIETPDRLNPRIRTVWIIDSVNDEPRLITAHPLRG